MNRVEKALSQAKVSIEMEDFKIKPEHTSLVKALLNKQISEKKFQQKVKDLLI